MPFTPFHFGAHTCAALPVNKKINLLVFILANVVIDIEPLFVMTLNLPCAIHGYTHTLIGAALIGGIWGIIAYRFKPVFEFWLKKLRLHSAYSRKQYIISGISGAGLHVIFDAMLYTDIKPFYPLSINPLCGLLSIPLMYIICTVLFLPAIILYFSIIKKVLS